MSRYLTPSKIGLLALISLYTESVIPSPATVPILSFLVSHLLPSICIPSRSEAEAQPRSVPLAIGDIQRTTIVHASGIPGRNVWDLLLHKLWKIDSINALHLFFDNLVLLLQKSPEIEQDANEDRVDPNPNRMLLSRVSPLGSFVRRAQVEFTRLPFHDGVALWKAFVAYRAPTLMQWKKRNPSAGDTSFDSNLLEDDLAGANPLVTVIYGDPKQGRRHEGSTSTEDVERLLEFQVDHMQSKFTPRSTGFKNVLNCSQEWATGFHTT